MAIWRRVLLMIFSCGWLLPIWWVENKRIGISAHLAAPNFVMLPDLFFFLNIAEDVFAIGVLWLSAVICYWIWVATERGADGTKPE